MLWLLKWVATALFVGYSFEYTEHTKLTFISFKGRDTEMVGSRASVAEMACRTLHCTVLVVYQFCFLNEIGEGL